MVTGFTVFDTQMREALVRERLLAWLAGGFGVLAAIVATIGVYGVISISSCGAGTRSRFGWRSARDASRSSA